MRPSRHALLLLLLASLTACTAEQPGDTSENNMSSNSSAKQDMQPSNNRQSGEDMKPAVDEEDMKMAASVDMRPGQTEPEDMPADVMDMRMITDMDAIADMGSEPDMRVEDMKPELMYPDAGGVTCPYPSADPMCPMGPHGPGSFISEFVVVEDKSCCRDFDGDGDNENFVGADLVSLANQFGGINVNQNTTQAINAGELVFLFEFENWNNDQYDPDITMRMLTGYDADANFADNVAGFGSFYVSEDSYKANGDPRWGFESARVHNGEFLATGGTLRIYFPGLVEDVTIILADAQIEADVTPGAVLGAGGGVALTNGKLSGAILRKQFFESMNAVSSNCACIGDDMFREKTNGSYECLFREDKCTTDPDSACRLTGRLDLCAGLALYSTRVDVDIDNDGKKDAFGFGATFKSVPATLLEEPAMP